MGFHLVFFWVLWSILVLQTLRQFAHIFSFWGVESKLSSISVKCDTYPNLTEHSHFYLYLIVLREGKSHSCHLVVLPNKFAFEENKLINSGRVVSMTVFLYFFLIP